MGEAGAADAGIAPYPLAMVVCDAIHRDPGTGKVFVLGTFSAIASSSFPACHPALSIYVALTDAHGSFDVDLTVVDVNEEREPVARFTVADHPSADPRAVHEICLFFANLVFPHPGEYRVKLSASGEFLMERRIVLVEHLRESDD